ncbi:hypothetical protein [Saccharopolyspora sp. 5N708]|uniref:hypothetical protein n=1 Tax=Saccharopolyspora sp. 5N708 TaxID=3457424 RepID=UPI003FD17C4F
MSSLEDIVRAITTADPDSTDASDLEALRDLIGNARVVCLGEGDHDMSEFYRLKQARGSRSRQYALVSGEPGPCRMLKLRTSLTVGASGPRGH